MYKAIGKRDPKWDEPATKFLDALAHYFANSKAEDRYRIEPLPTLKELEVQGRALIALGCDDPLVVYGLAVALDNQDKRQEVRPLLQKVLDDLPTSRYPINRLTGAANRMLKFYDRTNEQERAAYERCEQMLLDATLASISVADFRGTDRRAVLSADGAMIDARPMPTRKRFCEKAKAVGADAWLLNMIEGRYHIDAAWTARGHGYADTVTEEGWAGFARHLEQARACFTKAWELEPTYPEAAAEMITVAMGEPAGKGQSLRTWFDRAVTAQFDYQPAYTKYLWAIWPRWHGSHAKMLAFGRECAATRRYDTRVPYVLIDCVEAIAEEVGESGGSGAARAWRRPGVYPAAAEVLQGYAAHPSEPARRGWYQSYNIGIAAHAKRYDEAAGLLEQAKGSLVWSAVDQTRWIAPRLRHQIRAMAGPQGATLRAAETAAEARTYDPAVKAYDAALLSLAPDDPSLPWVQNRLAELRLLKAFETGEWVDLQPGKDLFGWYSVTGQWSVDEQGSLVGTALPNGVNLICGAEFKPRYEMTGKLEFASRGKVPDPAAGPILRYARDGDSHGMWLRRTTQKVVIRSPDGKLKLWPAQVADKNEFRLQVWDGRAFGWVNGHQCFNSFSVPRMATSDTTRIGAGVQFSHGMDGMVLRFSDLKIRKLPKPPVGQQ